MIIWWRGRWAKILDLLHFLNIPRTITIYSIFDVKFRVIGYFNRKLRRHIVFFFNISHIKNWHFSLRHSPSHSIFMLLDNILYHLKALKKRFFIVFRILFRIYNGIENVITVQFLKVLEGLFPSQYIRS